MEEIVIPIKTIVWCEKALTALEERLVDLAPLRVEASHRCFYRIITESKHLILMDSPPELERNDLFTQFSQIFREHKIPVPTIIAANEADGLYLLNDLGSVHLEQCYDTEKAELALSLAIDMLPKIAAVDHPNLESYSGDRLAMELDIFSQWFAAELIRHPVDTALFADMRGKLVESALMQPKGCVHRDYHCRNLLLEDNQLGIVDFQDALRGPILYDIASLLRDCYYTFSEAEVDRWFDYYLAREPRLKEFDRPVLKSWFDLLAIQRQLKAVGIFSRLHLRDGKSTHLKHILPVLNRTKTLASEYDELQPLVVQLNNCTKSATQKLNTLL